MGVLRTRLVQDEDEDEDKNEAFGRGLPSVRDQKAKLPKRHGSSTSRYSDSGSR
ncbi:hypothetical protein FKW77_005745 [Venturia effusa]|uniref:Uncharacterized protein n=1 Tax=Venturia effusa TaxID=50376 RepID=A0A517LIX9_9PEZI|nr:hypothetical protein FKW77_005745 [Venturia effusa]